jgi:hypothetical protein
LAAISSQVHHEDRASLERSLQDWWQWLDDEGFQRDVVASLFRQVSGATIGAEALQALEGQIKTHREEPQGLPSLIELLHQEHPNLAQELENLETLALTEEQQLHQRAGGLTSGQRGAVAGGVIGGALLTAGTIFLTVKKGKAISAWFKKKWGTAIEAVNTDERKVKEEKQDLDRKADEERELGANKVEASLDTLVKNPADRSGKVDERLDRAWKAAQNEAQYEPTTPVDLGKSLTEYTEKDIDTHAAKLVEKHADAFADIWFTEEIKPRIAHDIRGKDEYKDMLDKAIHEEKADPLNGGFEDDMIIKEATTKVDNSDWFQKQIKDVLFEGNLQQYEAAARAELTGHYKTLVEHEVNVAKRTARQEASDEFGAEISEGKAWFKESELKVDRDVAETARKLEREAAGAESRGDDLIEF